jgi:hypothetical protein
MSRTNQRILKEEAGKRYPLFNVIFAKFPKWIALFEIGKKLGFYFFFKKARKKVPIPMTITTIPPMNNKEDSCS